MPRRPSLTEALRSPDPRQRHRARQRVAAAWKKHRAVAAAARALGVAETTVRRWRHYGEEDGPVGTAAPEPAAGGAPATDAAEMPPPRRGEPATGDAGVPAAPAEKAPARPAGAAAGAAGARRSRTPAADVRSEATAAPGGSRPKSLPGGREAKPAVADEPERRRDVRRSPWGDFLPRHRRALGAPPKPPRHGGFAYPVPSREQGGLGGAEAAPSFVEEPVGGTGAGGAPSPGDIARPATWRRPAGGPVRRVAFVLHAHLPWVLGHGHWPHGEAWLAQATSGAYLPVLAALQRLADQGARGLLTLSVTPVLAAQLADARFGGLIERHLAAETAAADRLRDRHPLASWWRARTATVRRSWEYCGGDLIGWMRRLEGEGAVELGTSAATHAYLPLLHRDATVRLQLEAGRRTHERLFGRSPRGWWLPECGYRPGGPWRHPLTAVSAAGRAGLEELLAEQGAAWTVTDLHLVRGGGPVTGYGFPWTDAAGGFATDQVVPPPVRPGEGALIALVREPRTARQVWSRQVGYPGDAAYLDFHKRDEATGLRLWRVTDPEGDLSGKLPYWPPAAEEVARSHAEDFVGLVSRLPADAGQAVVCAFDAELFGHWWFEGPLWLEAVLQRLGASAELATTTGEAEAARARRGAPKVALHEGSWGEGGDHRVWADERVAPLWRDLLAAEDAVGNTVRRGLPAAVERALLAQLCLMASSDWPFLVVNDTARDYAEERFTLHRQRVNQLLAITREEDLPEWTRQELESLDLDGRQWLAGMQESRS